MEINNEVSITYLGQTKLTDHNKRQRWSLHYNKGINPAGGNNTSIYMHPIEERIHM